MSVKPKRPEGYDLGALHGKHFERDRIIALLEQSAEDIGQCCQGHASDRELILAQVALIKGEPA